MILSQCSFGSTRKIKKSEPALHMMGSLFRSSNTFSAVTSDPFGCVMHFGAVCSFMQSAGAPVSSNDMLAHMSSRAMVLDLVDWYSQE